MLKSLIYTIKRKLYLYNLKKNNPTQFEIEFKYSPERGKPRFDFKEYLQNNHLALIAIIISIIALFV